MKQITNLTGNPINALKFLFDPEIPLWFRLTLGLLGLFLWGSLIWMVVK